MYRVDENGNVAVNEKYREILKLDKMLTEAGIPHTLERAIDGWQVCYPVSRRTDHYNCVMDAVENAGSYGHEKDLLEIMGLLTPEEADYDSVAGYLTAENVFNRIKKHWKRNKEN